MSYQASVNDQITDAVNQSNVIVEGNTPAHSQNLLDIISAESLGLFMQNAVAGQQHAQMTANASITSACAKMLGTQIPQPKQLDNSAAPPPFMPLDGSADKSKDPTHLLSTAEKMTEYALKLIKDKGDKNDSATKALAQLKKTLDSQ